MLEKRSLLKRFTLRSIKSGEAVKAAEIERICFPPHVACTSSIMHERVRCMPDYFLVAIEKETDKMAGFINGLASDEEHLRDDFFLDASRHQEGGQNVMILGLDVPPEYRHQGLASLLVDEYLKMAYLKDKKQVILTCLADKIEMYERLGFKDRGLSDSSWGHEKWHEMVYVINEKEKIMGAKTFTEVATKKAPAAIGTYSQGIKKEAGLKEHFVYTSGQIGLDPTTGEFAGTDVETQMKQAMENLQAILEEAGSGLDQVMKVTIFMTDINDFGKVNAIYESYMSEPYPARSAVQVAALPKGALVEVEAEGYSEK